MVRLRRVNGAIGGTLVQGGEEIHRTVSRSEEQEIPPEPALEIQISPEDPKEIPVREGIHERVAKKQ